MSISGSIRKSVIDGVTYNAAADANAARTPRVTKEGIPTSGNNLIKITKAHGSVEGLTLILDPEEYETLLEISNGTASVPLSYELASGKVYRSEGHINLDNYESEENRCDVTMIPDNGTWQLFG